MGIDAQAFSKSLPKGRIWRTAGRNALILIEKRTRYWATANEFGPFFASVIDGEKTLSVSIMPLADSINFEVTSDGVSVGFRSSNGGPGYHSAVINMLDDLAGSLKISWYWGRSKEECSDETCYAITRDFADLQMRMADFLKFLMEIVVHENGEDSIACLPLELGHDSRGLSCPLGPKSKLWPYVVQDADADQLLVEAATFFPMWDREKTPLFWHSILLGMLWQNASWRAPVHDHEIRAVAAIEYAASKLKELSGEVDKDLSKALEEFRTSIENDQPPQTDGIGYLRRLVRRTPFKGWSIMLPGWWVEDSDNDGSTIVYYHHDTALRISNFTSTSDQRGFSEKEALSMIWTSEFDDMPESRGNGLIWRKSTPYVEEGMAFVQHALIAPMKSKPTNLVMLTLACDSEEKLVAFDKWLHELRYSKAG